MAITRVLGKPSLFITFTANPNWPEIKRNLEHGQSSDARPDLIAIVFKQKLEALLYDLKERQIFGKCIGCVYTIEYQKRGLPHAHILIFLHRNDVPRCAEDVDQLVVARVPTHDPVLAEVVKTQMTHGPCGEGFATSPCMRNGRCSKGFPKRWCEATVMTEGTYPEYARPQDGLTWGGERFTFDNRWVVPYNPFLSKKYGAHINVEVAKGVHAIKYLAKYVYKGTDRATLAIGDRYDEISMTLQGRYICPSQAVWRLLEYTTHQEKPAVMNLPFHLEGLHQVYFGADLNAVQLEAAVSSQSSAFLDWMAYNSSNSDGRDLLYSDFPLFFTHKKSTGWHPRAKGNTIGRMPVAHPTQGEHYFLRTLLTIKKGVRSYRDLYCVDGVQYDCASAACRALGLISDDSEWISYFDEIRSFATASSLRRTFASAISFATVVDPQSVWDRFKDNFTDDCLYRIRTHGHQFHLPPDDWSDDSRRYDFGLWLLGENFSELNLTWESARMVGPRHRWLTRENNPLIADAMDFNQEEEKNLFEIAVAALSPGQKNAFETIINAIDNGESQKTFFLQGPAGTGKTFLYKTLCHKYRSEGKIVLCAASSGIAALLLPNGRTSHSLFKIPINSNESTMCRIPGNSHLANLLRRTHLIIWDEVTLQRKDDFASVDRYLRWLHNSGELFGGVPVVLGGDFAQILPVVRRGRREQIVNACIQSWSEWHLIKQLYLTQNMRVVQGHDNKRFADWLSILSYADNLRGLIDIPDWIRTTDDRNVFRESVYPRNQLESPDDSLFTDRAILSSRNDSVEIINNDIAQIRRAESREYFARDEVKDDSDAHISEYTTEFLYSLSPAGLPLGTLKLQVGMPVMLLRNLYPNQGLCNGTRLIITRLFQRGVQARIVSPDLRYNGKEHFIHRIPLTSSDDLPFTLTRNQLPLRPCFAMTINKSQGQTLQCVGVDLSSPVFSHGQLYVALSRVTDVSRLIVLLPPGRKQTQNIVYPEVLLRPR